MQYSALLAIGLSALASGAAIPTLTKRSVSAQEYDISTLKTHFMGKNSGLGDGSWPPGSEFNSTIELVVNYPGDDDATASTTCTGTWVNGSHPTDWNACDDAAVAWKFAKFTTEAKFTLEIGRSTGAQSSSTGSVDVTSNNLADDNSWLTCLAGPPLQGLKCNLDGALSKQKAPIPVGVISGPAISL
ncbi:hypothetical protein MPH_04436 [Macrophomina phaseolina MS6]|uniref:AA1-like domain-containing protein n=1 Tax=Macrophomina phaseolina (strain MS6) TaxID=1126212 RepID=K2S7D9_MACPH|nr:hypothetical protein MPH_04436 [Macrophomina phaseolina MS6]